MLSDSCPKTLHLVISSIKKTHNFEFKIIPVLFSEIVSLPLLNQQYVYLVFQNILKYLFEWTLELNNLQISASSSVPDFTLTILFIHVNSASKHPKNSHGLSR